MIFQTFQNYYPYLICILPSLAVGFLLGLRIGDPDKRVVPEGYHLIKDSTYRERSFAQERPTYRRDCFVCDRGFEGGGTRRVCQVCEREKNEN